MPDLAPFDDLAAVPDPPLDLLALALAAELQPVDATAALTRLDALGAELLDRVGAPGAHTPAEEVAACRDLLGAAHGFTGDREDYDAPENSMLDIVLERRRGLPILLSVVYVEVARRAGVALRGVGLPGHFVAGHFGADPPVLLDPFNGGAPIDTGLDTRAVRPWSSQEIALRMLNNLVASYTRRGDLGRAIRAAEMRLRLPADRGLREELEVEHRSLAARMN